MFGTAGIYMTSKKDNFNVDFKSNYFYNRNTNRCNYTSDCGFAEQCDTRQQLCECIEFYQRDYNTGLCEICPSLGSACGGCCRSVELMCVDGICECNYYEHPSCSSHSPGVLVTASQIALSAALIMGIAALAMVVYRLCTRPKYLSARHRAALARARGNQNDNDPGNNFPSDARASLSSMQIRVINRLRDRPPTYDGINNPNTRDRNTNAPSTTVTNVTTTTTILTNNNSTLLAQRNVDAPPPYLNSENQLELELHRPPPYTEVVLCPAGYLNESYTNTENSSNNNVTGRNNNNNENDTNVTINISDNTLTIQKDCNGNGIVNNDSISDMKNIENNTNKNSKKDDKDNNNNESSGK